MEKGTTEITDMVFSETNEEREDEEKKSGGIINSLISNLVAPLSPKVRDADDSASRKENNGGIFNSLVSGILHQTGGDDDREGSAAADGGGGVVDSHFPATSLADDAAIATDEASILIHSIVHD